MIKHVIMDDCVEDGILLPEVTSKILSKVIKYYKKHVESPKLDDCATGAVDGDLKAWDVEFVKVDQDTIFDLILAANYLNIKSMLDLTCQIVLDLTEDKSLEEMNKWFNIKVHPENQGGHSGEMLFM
ncbi:hypothetical protein EZV62_000179 [Acer yangbiense]|uniref:SKP1-like protein n=1 Tax=Acer yangbiense TaxID=1000413 RepID=A0A5C7IQK4_9ROSI|nr:hypothetical protein EZV62_000179 [Acer yangbiense]